MQDLLNIYKEIVNVLESGEKAVLATIVATEGSTPRKAGAKMLIKQSGDIIGTIGGGPLEETVLRKSKEVLETGNAQLLFYSLSAENAPESVDMLCGGKVTIFLEPITSPQHILIVGAGHISRALATFAKLLSFKVTVIDSRKEYATAEQVPEANTVEYVNVADAKEYLKTHKFQYVILLNPTHQLDEEWLKAILEGGFSFNYIGMIGSHNKFAVIKNKLLKEGIAENLINLVHTPIGLDIGAETPSEIALSIVAEIVSIKNKKC